MQPTDFLSNQDWPATQEVLQNLCIWYSEMRRCEVRSVSLKLEMQRCIFRLKQTIGLTYIY